jgi:hypothetical protein
MSCDQLVDSRAELLAAQPHDSLIVSAKSVGAFSSYRWRLDEH